MHLIAVAVSPDLRRYARKQCGSTQRILWTYFPYWPIPETLDLSAASNDNDSDNPCADFNVGASDLVRRLYSAKGASIADASEIASHTL
jgi:hypothetical protein